MTQLLVKIPAERIGVLIGPEGVVKKSIQKQLSVNLEIDSEAGTVNISLNKDDRDPSYLFTAKDVVGATFEGTGLTEQDERLDKSDKSMPIREHDCTICMACQEACPTGAILIEQANGEYHEKAAGTYVKMEGSGGPHSHD